MGLLESIFLIWDTAKAFFPSCGFGKRQDSKSRGARASWARPEQKRVGFLGHEVRKLQLPMQTFRPTIDLSNSLELSMVIVILFLLILKRI